MNNKPYYTVKEIAEELNMNYRTLLRRVQSGELKAVRIGKIFRVSAEEYRAYLSRSEKYEHSESN